MCERSFVYKWNFRRGKRKENPKSCQIYSYKCSGLINFGRNFSQELSQTRKRAATTHDARLFCKRRAFRLWITFVILNNHVFALSTFNLV